MGTIQHAINVAGSQLQKAITDRHIFSSVELCFGYFYDDTYDRVSDDRYDDTFAQMVSDHFAELFDDHFGTEFSG